MKLVSYTVHTVRDPLNISDPDGDDWEINFPDSDLVLVWTNTVVVEQFDLDTFREDKLKELSEKLDIEYRYMWLTITLLQSI